MDEKGEKMEWIGKEEINSMYVDAISMTFRGDAIKVELGQVISEREEKKTRVKIVGSFIMNPHVFKYTILDVLNSQMKAYEETYGALKPEKEK